MDTNPRVTKPEAKEASQQPPGDAGDGGAVQTGGACTRVWHAGTRALWYWRLLASRTEKDTLLLFSANYFVAIC